MGNTVGCSVGFVWQKDIPAAKSHVIGIIHYDWLCDFWVPYFQTDPVFNWDVLGWFSDMVHSTRMLMVGSIFLFLPGVSMPIRDRSIVSEVSLWKTSNLYNTSWPQFPNYSRETYPIIPIIPIASKSVVAAAFVVTTLTPLRINGANFMASTDRQTEAWAQRKGVSTTRRILNPQELWINGLISTWTATVFGIIYDLWLLNDALCLTGA